MSFIIFISSRIRHGQPVRLPGFAWSSKHGAYIYGGRELSLEEFNAAAAVVFAKEYRGKSFSFMPKAIEEPPVEPPAEPPVEVAVEPPAEPPVEPKPIQPPFTAKVPRRSAAWRAEHGGTLPS